MLHIHRESLYFLGGFVSSSESKLARVSVINAHFATVNLRLASTLLKIIRVKRPELPLSKGQLSTKRAETDIRDFFFVLFQRTTMGYFLHKLGVCLEFLGSFKLLKLTSICWVSSRKTNPEPKQQTTACAAAITNKIRLYVSVFVSLCISVDCL